MSRDTVYLRVVDDGEAGFTLLRPQTGWCGGGGIYLHGLRTLTTF